MKAFWRASKTVQKKRAKLAASGAGAQGAFAASAMAMFKNNEGEEGQPGADGVVGVVIALCWPFLRFNVWSCGKGQYLGVDILHNDKKYMPFGLFAASTRTIDLRWTPKSIRVQMSLVVLHVKRRSL